MKVDVNRLLNSRPTSDGELFDMIFGLFGIGDFDELSGQQWWHFRMREIAKLKAMRKTRQISLADFAEAARYCYRHPVLKVTESWQLCGFIGDAKREAHNNAVPHLTVQVRDALEIERTSPGPDSQVWIERLLLTRGPHRAEVLDEWKTSREGWVTTQNPTEARAGGDGYRVKHVSTTYTLTSRGEGQ